MKKRIAIAIDSLAGGGAERVAITLAMELHRQGHEPHLLIMLPHIEHQVPEVIPTHFCFEHKNQNIDSVINLKRSANQLRIWIDRLEQQYGRFDLFLSNLDKTNILMTKVKVSPLYCVVHNSIVSELTRQRKLGPLAYFKMRRAKRALNGQHLITVSKGIETELKQLSMIKPASVTTIYNPFDFEAIQVLAQSPLPENIPENYIVHVGRVAKQKRHDVLFKSLAKMHQNIPLVLLCGNPKKAYKIAKRYGVAEKVILPGFQANPYPWIKHARLLVLSSDYEGLPTVLIESLICHTPIVSTTCPHGPTEIMTGELAQFLVPMRSAAALADTMDAALSQYPTLDDASILRQVSQTQVAKQYLALLD
ncbi:glycosyltransferase [Shewanella waksmanii]|uniref:glycosyltransferase n=1 Tax=Shewanella waksmanii TaxID=213783 RepID=UPI003735E0DA